MKKPPERLLKVRFEWGRKFTADDVPTLQKFVEGERIQVTLKEDGTLDYSCRDFLMTLTEANAFGGEFEVVKVLPYCRASEAESHFELLDSFGPRSAPPPVNERCKVVVAAAGGLLEIRETKVALDYCTEALQRELNEGWRILAICVQPDQRRPDYVLGRAAA